MNRRSVVVAGIAGSAAFGLVAVMRGDTALGIARIAVCGGALAAVAVSDLRQRRIPNRIVLPALGVSLVLALATPAKLSQLLPGLLLVCLLLTLAVLSPSAFGMGDVKAALLIAVALGTAAEKSLLLGLTLATIAGLGIVIRHGRAALTRALPLAPFLALGALLALALP